MGLVLLAGALTLIGLLRFAFPSYREGTYRRGFMWYLGLGTREEVGLPTPVPRQAKTHSAVAMGLSTAAGTGLLALAPIGWIVGYPVLGILAGVLGLAFLALALADWRENRDVKSSDEACRQLVATRRAGRGLTSGSFGLTALKIISEPPTYWISITTRPSFSISRRSSRRVYRLMCSVA